MSRARGVLCRACLALAAVLAVLLLLPLPLPLPRAPAPDPGRIPTPGLTLEVSRLQPDDVFIAVKTTRKNHGPRLRLLLRTWISRAPRQVRAPPPTLRFLSPGLAPAPLGPGTRLCSQTYSLDPHDVFSHRRSFSPMETTLSSSCWQVRRSPGLSCSYPGHSVPVSGT